MRGYSCKSEKIKIEPKDLTEGRLEVIQRRLGYACESYGLNPADAIAYYREDVTDLLAYIKNIDVLNSLSLV